MDFETSCWGTNGGQTLFNYDNPVQRRSKIDYFDSASITPIVSHISSNGYYGYCPINVPSCIDMDASNGAKIASDIDFGGADMQTMDSSNSEQINHHQHHQGRPIFENRKRHAIAVELVENDAKRRRSHLPVEDIQMAYADEKDITFASSNIAFNKLPNDQFIACINENLDAVDHMKMEHDSNQNQHTLDQSSINFKSKSIYSDANNAIEKTDDDNDMENLYWHTHGSVLWQR